MNYGQIGLWVLAAIGGATIFRGAVRRAAVQAGAPVAAPRAGEVEGDREVVDPSERVG